MEGIKELLRERILSSVDLNKEIEDSELFDKIDHEIISYSKEEYVSMQEKLRLRRDIFNSIRRLDILQELIEDPTITEIMVNGPDHIFLERNGKIYPCNRGFETMQKLEDVVQQIVKVNKYIGYDYVKLINEIRIE